MEEDTNFGSSPMAEESQFNAPEPKSEYVSPQERQKRKFPKKFLYLLAAVLVILLVFNAIKVLTSPKQTSTIVTVTPTPITTIDESTPTPEAATPTPEPSATPAATTNPIDKATGLDRSQLSVAIQNGSGEAGVGAKGADYLKGLGYTISGTGNADNFNYTNVTIQVKSDSKYLDLLKKDLGLNYTVGSASADLSSSASSDAVVIIGK